MTVGVLDSRTLYVGSRGWSELLTVLVLLGIGLAVRRREGEGGPPHDERVAT